MAHTRTNIALTFLGLLTTIAAAATVYLYLDLQRAEADLADTGALLHTTRTELQTTTEAFVAERITRKKLQLDNAALESSLTQANEENVALETSLTQANEEHVVLQSSLTKANEDNAAVESSLTKANEDKAALESSLADAQTRYASLNMTKDRIDAERRELIRKVGDIDRLKEQEAALQLEIVALQEQRRPLILSTSTGSFACTGSMEPKITCLDTATWLDDPGPAEIVVGATIAFPGTTCWPDEDDYDIVHRVIDIDVREGQNHYLTKGDANREPDCWVPHADVQSYIIELHKNTVPENAKLRNYVNDSRRALSRALKDLEAADASYEATLQHYLDLRARLGCPNDREQTCYASGAAYTQLLSAWRQLRSETTKYNNALAVYKEALRYHTCWLNSARRSTAPGLILTICISFPVVIEFPPLDDFSP